MLEVAGRMEGPLEVRATMPQEREDDLERLLEAPERVVLGQAEGVGLAAGMPRAEPQHEAPAGMPAFYPRGPNRHTVVRHGLVSPSSAFPDACGVRGGPCHVGCDDDGIDVRHKDSFA